MARWLGEPAVLPEAPGSQLYNPSSREYPPLMCEHVCAPGTYVHIWCAYMQNTGNTHKIKFGSLLFVCFLWVFFGGVRQVFSALAVLELTHSVDQAGLKPTDSSSSWDITAQLP